MPESPGQIFTGTTLLPNQEWLLDVQGAQIKSVALDAAARDATNTRTTYLRQGLAMGQVTVGGKWKEYDDGDADGTEVCAGILYRDVDMLNPFGAAAVAPLVASIVILGRIRAAKCIGLDANGKADLRTANWIVEEDFE